ncbi:hypothetical protein ACEQ8H_007132 [Pleosporales sp. CAS-2024a]
MAPRLWVKSIPSFALAFLLPHHATGQSHHVLLHKPLTEEILRAIREEMWATNQMQLAAFYENDYHHHRYMLCPHLQQANKQAQQVHPDKCVNVCPSTRGPDRHHGLISLLVFSLFMTWVFSLFWAIWQRAKKDYSPKGRSKPVWQHQA